MNGRQPRVAVVGAGAWGRNIVRNLAELGALAAVVDPSAEIRAGLQQQYPGLRSFAEFASILSGDYDAVAIAAPVPLHYELGCAALKAGLDVFIEKPITQTSREAEELSNLARARKRVLMAGHLLLYQPAVRWMKHYLQSEELGELYGVHLERLTLGRVRSVESVLWDLGVHDIAVILDLAAEQPLRIRAAGHRILRAHLEDDIYVHFDFPSGLRADLHTSWLWPETQRRMIVRGDKGMLIYNEVQQTVTLYRKTVTSDLKHHDEGSELIYQGHGQPLRLEMEHFLARIRDRKPALSDGRSAVAVMRVMEEVSRILEV